MRNVSNIRVLFILLVGLVTTGCAHKELIDAGEDYNRQGRYELAVVKYSKALELKPNNKKTRAKLNIAQLQLDLWLDDLLIEADAAKQNGLDGRALLLYSKVAKLRNEPDARDQYKQLHQQLGNDVRYKVAAQYPTTLGKNLGHRLKDIQVINKADKNQSNQFAVKLSYSKPTFKTRTKLKDRSKSYVSGVETVANPDYLHLQDDIRQDRENVHNYAEQYDHLYLDVQAAQRKLTSLRKDREIAQLKMGNAPQNSSTYQHWNKEVNRLNGLVSNAEQSLSNFQHEYDDIDHKLTSIKKQLSKHLNELSYLHPTAQQDVYSDYDYQVKEVTRMATGKLTLAFVGEGSKSKNISTSNTDIGHESHPTIDLDHNPVKLKTKPRMTSDYYGEARKQAEKALTQHMTDYRNNLRDEANQLSGIDEKLEAWVRYGLSGEKGVDQATKRRMQNQLQQEFGIAGEFNINKLLHLYIVR
jgi:predicted  nucleic acid-binding Zn-ribbon protein